MKESVQVDDQRMRWYQYLGPWPIRPWVLGLALGFYYLSLASGATQYATGQANGEQVLANTLRSAISAVVVALVLKLVGSWRPVNRSLGPYLLVCALGAILGFAVRFLLGSFSGTLSDIAPYLILLAITRSFLVIVVVQAIAGTVTMRLSKQVAETQEALHQARAEQERMLLADEESRKQISGLLHDRVQAGLIASCLELQMLALDRPPEEKQRITAIVERLENLRSMDVRSVARVLSPNLADVDLVTALDELAAQYDTVMTTTFTVDPKIDGFRDTMGERVLLGTYRIIEQGLLNAAGHGRARNCAVTVKLNADKEILISIEDDGVGFGSGPVRQGVGGALISTWTRSLEGTWGWNDNVAGGVILTARIPISPL